MLLRRLALFLLVTLVLAGATAACGAPGSAGQAQSPAQAEATNVRRTAVAEVQRQIANPPPATPTPPATPIPRPTCQGALWWHEARAHVGEARTLQGTIVAIRPLADGAALLELGQPYPDPTGVAVLLQSAWPGPAELSGKQVCVAGRIEATGGRPTLQLRDRSSIVVVN